MKSFREFVNHKSILNEEGKDKGDWKKEYVKMEKGFTPPANLRSVVQAFLDSGDIELTNDVSKSVTLPKKTLYLVGGPVRDFLANRKIKDHDLATSATPEQIALILHNAGFKVPKKSDEKGDWSPDFDRTARTDKKGNKVTRSEMKLSFKPDLQKNDDDKIWYLKGRDSTGKPFVIGAVVNGEEFDIATFRKDAKTVNGQSEVDFVDNPVDDAARRDFTINAMYIELGKADGENSKLYDPTRKGYHDVHSGRVRAVGKADERFEEDKLRVMRAIRMHCKFGKGPMDEEIKRAIPRFRDLDGVALERVREEFLKGLEDESIDARKYLSVYASTGLLSKVLPGVALNLDVPTQLRNKKDKFLALAWILQDNSMEKVAQVLSSMRTVGDKTLNTGWSDQERSVVMYLLKLKEFDADNLDELLRGKKIIGITKDQIKKWVHMFDAVDGSTVKSLRPNWAKRVRTFADFQPDASKLVTWFSRDSEGRAKQEVHPELAHLSDAPPHFRGSIIKDANKKRLRQMFDDALRGNE